MSGHVKGYKIYTGDSIDALKQQTVQNWLVKVLLKIKRNICELGRKVTAQYVRIEFVDCYEPSAANVSKDVACCSEFDFLKIQRRSL